MNEIGRSASSAIDATNKQMDEESSSASPTGSTPLIDQLFHNRQHNAPIKRAHWMYSGAAK